MTTGIQANGVDIDTLFLPLETTKRADVNIDSNGGVDISNRFEPIGDGTPIANTGIQANGADIATLFRDINEPLEQLVWTTTPWTFFTEGGGNDPPPVGLIIDNDGDTQRNIGGGFNEYQDWLSNAPNGNGANWEYYYDNFSGNALDSDPPYQTWTTLGTDRLWSYNLNSSNRSCTFTVAIRASGDTGAGIEKTIQMTQTRGG